MKFYSQDFGADLSVEDSKDWGDLVNLTHFDDIDEFNDGVPEPGTVPATTRRIA